MAVRGDGKRSTGTKPAASDPAGSDPAGTNPVDTDPGDTNPRATDDAGDLSVWLAEVQGALRGEHDAVVPCGTCTACCRSAQFVHIAPDETDTLAHIPPALLFPAPRRPKGHVLLGYDERGHCPMLVDDRCSIYEHRPRTCRVYDCRVFAATGVEPGVDKPLLGRRVQQWRFDVGAGQARAELEALRAAAAALGAGRAGVPPVSPTERAVRALELHRSYLPPPRRRDATEVS